MLVRFKCVSVHEGDVEDPKLPVINGGKPMKDKQGFPIFQVFNVQTAHFRVDRQHPDNHPAWSDARRAEGALPHGELMLQDVNKTFAVGDDVIVEIKKA